MTNTMPLQFLCTYHTTAFPGLAGLLPRYELKSIQDGGATFQDGQGSLAFSKCRPSLKPSSYHIIADIVTENPPFQRRSHEPPIRPLKPMHNTEKSIPNKAHTSDPSHEGPPCMSIYIIHIAYRYRYICSIYKYIYIYICVNTSLYRELSCIVYRS